VPEGSTVRRALANTLDLARHAERLGFRRYWLAEHHNMTGVASAATAVLIGAVAATTERIVVGAGGIMLPNHAPLMIAEAFGTLAELYPGRIELGLGRAPGTDPATVRALRRYADGAEQFPRDVVELLGYLGDREEGAAVRAVPGEGTNVPVWILGSSIFGAQLAALLGLPYAFASHFAPSQVDDALAIYRERFRPSRYLDRPHLMLALNVFAADTDAKGRRLQTSMQLAFANLQMGRPGPLPRSVEDIRTVLDPDRLAGVQHALTFSAVGAAETVRRQIEGFVERYRPDELILTGQIHDHHARLRSFEIVAAALAGRTRLAPMGSPTAVACVT
jgi:luciferase family oxidoreductase group 1